MGSQITGYGSEFGTVAVRAVDVEAVIDMIVDQNPLGIGHGLFDGPKLLGDIDAGPMVFEHGNHGPQVAIGTFQPGNEGRMACMKVWFCHSGSSIPPGGLRQGSAGALQRIRAD